MADLIKEIMQDLLSVFAVSYFRVELHRIERFFGIFH